MNEPTPMELALIALMLLDRNREWTNSQAMEAAYIFWKDCKSCIVAMRSIYPPNE